MGRSMSDAIVLLGIGNVLWADEGFGIRVVEHLQKHYRFADNVQVIDGGTQGMLLIDYVLNADILVIFDAVDFGLPAATVHALQNEQVPNFLGAKKMSLHQTGFQEVLASAELLGHTPEHILLVGVQPAMLEDYGGSLSPAVKQQIEPAIKHALAFLQAFSVAPEKISRQKTLTDPIMNIDRYEQDRPSEQQACRVGDARVLQSDNITIKAPQALQNSIVVDVDHRGKYD